MTTKNKTAAASRLPVHGKNSKPLLAGRSGERLVASVSDYKEALSDLPGLAAELLDLNRQKAALEATADTIRYAIRMLMAEVKDDESWTVRSDDTDWVATYIKPKDTKKLIPELLILAGVTDKQLKKGYKTIPAKEPYVQVRTKGEGKNNEEHE